MSDHRGSERGASRSLSHHSSPARSRSRSRSSERLRKEHNEHNEADFNNETHNNSHRESHDNHASHRSISNHTNTTCDNYTSYTPLPTSPFRCYRNAEHRGRYYHQDEVMFPGLPGIPSLPGLSYPSRTSRNPFRTGHHDNYYGDDQYCDCRRSGIDISSSPPGAALGLAAGAMGGFLGSNALNGEARRSRSGYGKQPYSSHAYSPHPNSLVPQPYTYDQSFRGENRTTGRGAGRRGRANALVDERATSASHAPGSSSNRDSRMRALERETKSRAERSDWDHFRPGYRSSDRVLTIPSAQGDSTHRARGRTYETSNSNGNTAREYRADGTINEAGVNVYDVPSKDRKREGGNKKENQKEREPSKMSGAYGIPLERLGKPDGRVGATAKVERPASPSYERFGGVKGLFGGSDGVLEDHIVLQRTVPVGMGRMPESVRLERRPSRLGTFMGKLCGSARE